MKRWDAAQVPDLTGKVVIVTGGNTGIGFQAASQMAGKGAETILACRNETKARSALRHIKRKMPEAKVLYEHLDLASLSSIRRFADRFMERFSRLDILLNNAGIILKPYRTTEDGFESQIGINHLGHFALTGLLMERIAGTDGARVVNVSSRIYRKGKLDFENFLYRSGDGFTRVGAYSRSKLANLLFTYELDRRFRSANLNAKAAAAHPGYSYTDFGRAGLFRVLKVIFYPLVITVTQNAARGALSSLRASVDPAVEGGDFYGPGGIWEIKGYPVRINSNGASHHMEDARLLWELSEEMTGIRYL
ncbi:MAG: oxidoreductase [Bacteroidales bacterium]